MAEPRRSGLGSGTYSSRTSGRGGPSGRRDSSRRIISRPGAVPRWAYIALIAVPATGIVILLGIKTFRKPEAEAPPPVNQNEEIAVLEKQIPSLEKDYQEVQQLLRAEDPRAKARFEELQARLDAWVQRWDAILDSKRDENDRLPPEFQALGRTRSRVNQLLVDLNRSSPF